MVCFLRCEPWLQNVLQQFHTHTAKHLPIYDDGKKSILIWCVDKYTSSLHAMRRDEIARVLSGCCTRYRSYGLFPKAALLSKQCAKRKSNNIHILSKH